MQYGIGRVISTRANVGWSTIGHSGTDINLYATGVYSNELRGNYENVDVGNFVGRKFDLKKYQDIKTKLLNQNKT